jgi:CHASE2 domain-containing sensor protein
LLTFALDHFGWLAPFEQANLDTWQRLLPSRPARHVALVGIDDEAFDGPFEGESPLNPAELRRLLLAVRAGGPAVIGVDLDTSSFRRKPDYERLAADLAPAKVVWARDGVPEHGMFVPGRVLGGEGASVLSGVAAVPRDPDRVVREFRREFPIGGGRAMPSFHWAVVTAYCESAPQHLARCEPEEHAHELQLNLMRPRPGLQPIPAAQVIKASEGEAWRRPDGPLYGKIVLVGGVYRASRDRHATPLGEVYGLELLGHIVETELDTGGGAHASHVLLLALDGLVGLLLIWVHHRLPIWTAMKVNLLLAPAVSLAASLAAFSSLAFWLNFVPMTIGIVIHELYDNVKHARHLEKLAGGHT